ncbi:hypothetical protein B0H14DRAFT_3729359 [Mycena olivaceomarginata]|nr:hypothetical protein B0H14DRAFT_3729359 [Mycena olivaceomarginata]
MPRGKQSPLPADQIAYLESGLAEGWFERWRVEPTLGLPIIDSSIEESPLTEEQESAIGQAETKIRKRIHSWYNNRSQKEKRLANVTASNSAASGALNDIVAALGRKAGRRKQMIELWWKRNGPLITEALANTNFSSLMGTAPPGETSAERKASIQVGHRDQMVLRRRVEKELFAEVSEDEMTAVMEEYEKQKPEQRANVKAETPEDFQRGLDQLAPMLGAVHGVISDVTGGWVGTTMLTGPVPKEGGKIGTHSYCNGVTPAGHTMDEAVSGWATQWVKPLQQFGKKVFNHEARRERAIGFGETVRIPATQPEVTLPPPSSLGPGLYSMLPLPESSPDPDDSLLGNHFGDASMPPIVHDEDSIPPPPHDYNPGPLLHVDEIPIDPALLGIGSRSASVAPAPTQETGNHPAESMFPGPASSAAPCPASPICHPDDDFVITSISADSSSRSGLLTSLVAFRYNAGSPSHRPHGLSLPAARAIGTMAATPSPTANATTSPASMVTLSPSVSVATPAQSPVVTPLKSPRCDVHVLGAVFRCDARVPGAVPLCDTREVPRCDARVPGAVPRSRCDTRAARPSPLRQTVWTPTSGTPDSAAAAGESVVPRTSPVPLSGLGSVSIAQEETGSAPQQRAVDSGTAPTQISLPSAARVMPPPAFTSEAFPQSRPMCNAPLSPRGTGTTSGGAGGAGGTGRGGGAGRGAGRGRGRGRGGNRGRGRGGKCGSGKGSGGGVADRESGTGDDGDGDIGTGEEEPAAAPRMVPPGDAMHETVSRERLREIRAWEKERDDREQRAERNRDHGVHYFPPPLPGDEGLRREPGALGARPLELQQEPVALGPRNRRPPAGYQAPPPKRTMDQIEKDAAARKEAKLAATTAKKRSLPDSENQEPVVTKKSRRN